MHTLSIHDALPIYPLLYYLGINDENIDLQGIDMLEYDIKKLIDE